MKYILTILLFLSIHGFSQTQMAIFVKGQGYVYKTFPDSGWVSTQIANVSGGTVADGSITNAKLAGSISADKFVGSDLTITESQTTGLVADLAAKQGISVAATPATTGAMTTTMTSGTQTVFTITPTAACTFNASGGTPGAILIFVVTTSGTSTFTLTWGTNFKPVSTLATGTTSGKIFTVAFVCTNGTQWVETGRTAAH